MTIIKICISKGMVKNMKDMIGQSNFVHSSCIQNQCQGGRTTGHLGEAIFMSWQSTFIFSLVNWPHKLCLCDVPILKSNSHVLDFLRVTSLISIR